MSRSLQVSKKWNRVSSCWVLVKVHINFSFNKNKEQSLTIVKKVLKVSIKFGWSIYLALCFMGASSFTPEYVKFLTFVIEASLIQQINFLNKEIERYNYYQLEFLLTFVYKLFLFLCILSRRNMHKENVHSILSRQTL
jgi:hypothetical protein